jgi:hypothetical protein
VQRVGPEVGVAAREVDRVAVQRSVVVPSGERGEGAGVQPAGDEHTQRHVGDELVAHDVVQQSPDGSCRRGQVVLVRRALQRPVPAVVQPVAVDAHRPARHDLPEAQVHRVAGASGADDEHVGEAVRVDLRGEPRVRQHRLGLGAEQQAVGQLRVEQRLHAQVVAGQQQRLLPVVPHGEGEHALQVLDDPFTPLQVAAQQHLRVGTGAELVALGDQVRAEPCVVVDLAAEHDHGRGVVPVRHHRLGASARVEHGEPAVAQQAVR